MASSQIALVAPADFAAFSMVDLHMPQLPETANDSVLFCACNVVVQTANKSVSEKRLIFFMI